MPDQQPDDVLTLAEAASYLRVPEEELLRLAEQRDVPAQRIGGEWRVLKRALVYWLTFGPRFFRDYPPSCLGQPLLDEWLLAIEKRLRERLGPEKPERGSKEAVRKHVGVLKEEVRCCNRVINSMTWAAEIVPLEGSSRTAVMGAP